MKKGTLIISNPTSNVAFSISGEPISTGETWVINESPYISETATYTGINFISNNTSYTTLRFYVSDNTRQLMYGKATIPPRPPVIAYSLSDGWNITAYRTVTFETAPTGDLLTWLQANAVLTGNISSGSFSDTTINSATITGGSFLDCTIGDPDPETAAPQQRCEISGGQFKYTTWDAFKVRVLQNQLQAGYALFSIGDDWYEVHAVMQ